MNIEDIRLTDQEIVDAKFEYFPATLEDHEIADAATDKATKKIAEDIEIGLGNIWLKTISPNPMFTDGSQEQFYMDRMYKLQTFIAELGQALKKLAKE